MNNEIANTNDNWLTDSQKVMLCIGFLKGIINGKSYVASVDVPSVKEFIAEIQK